VTLGEALLVHADPVGTQRGRALQDPAALGEAGGGWYPRTVSRCSYTRGGVVW
jgi:hypothetical protein